MRGVAVRASVITAGVVWATVTTVCVIARRSVRVTTIHAWAPATAGVAVTSDGCVKVTAVIRGRAQGRAVKVVVRAVVVAEVVAAGRDRATVVRRHRRRHRLVAAAAEARPGRVAKVAAVVEKVSGLTGQYFSRLVLTVLNVGVQNQTFNHSYLVKPSTSTQHFK